MHDTGRHRTPRWFVVPQSYRLARRRHSRYRLNAAPPFACSWASGADCGAPRCRRYVPRTCARRRSPMDRSGSSAREPRSLRLARRRRCDGFRRNFIPRRALVRARDGDATCSPARRFASDELPGCCHHPCRLVHAVALARRHRCRGGTSRRRLLEPSGSAQACRRGRGYLRAGSSGFTLACGCRRSCAGRNFACPTSLL